MNNIDLYKSFIKLWIKFFYKKIKFLGYNNIEQNINIDIDYIYNFDESLLIYRHNFDMLSLNKNITYDFVKKHNYHNWNYYNLSINSNLTIKSPLSIFV